VEQKDPFYCKFYNFVYINLDKDIEKAFDQIEDFKEEFKIASEKLKHVKDKLFLHYMFINILENIKSVGEVSSMKVVLYITPHTLKDKKLKDSQILKQLKILKSVLPIPLIIPLEEEIFNAKNGNLIELNKKCLEFYLKRRVSLKQLKKYFDNKGFTTLTATLSNIVNLKGFYY